MTKRTQSDATWHTIDPTTLPAPIAKQFAHYKSAYAEMKAERKAFEDAMSAAISPAEGKRVVFGYNFGKLSVAVVDDDKPAAKSTPKALALADLCKR